MKLQGEHRFDAPRDEVWKALLDPEVLSRTVPGSEGLEQTGENEFSGKLKMKIGPVQGVFQGKVALSDLDPPSGYKMKIDGQGAPGFVSGTGVLSLADEGEGTLLSYDVDAQVGGRIASVGQRLVESSGKVITRQALEALETQIDARVSASPSKEDQAAGEAAEAAPLPAAPSQAKMVAGFAGGMASELLPAARGRWPVVAALLALAAILFWLFQG